MPNTPTKRYYALKAPTMSLDRAFYFHLSDNEFKLLSRIAVLTNCGKQPCNYTNAQASKELNLATRTTERSFSRLKQFKLIKLERMQSLSTKRGPKLRTITIISPLVVHKRAS